MGIIDPGLNQPGSDFNFLLLSIINMLPETQLIIKKRPSTHGSEGPDIQLLDAISGLIKS
jgi:hypothetical protein